MKKPTILLSLFIALSLMLSAGAFWYSSTLKIKSSDAASFGITPPYLNFENLTPGQEATASIRVMRGDSDKEQIVMARFDELEISDWITIIPNESAVLKKGENEANFTFAIKVPMDAYRGKHKGKLYFALLSTEQKSGVGISLGAKANVDISVIEGLEFAKNKTVKLDAVLADNKLTERLQGMFIMRVESFGEIYYIHPQEKKIYSLSNTGDFRQMMKDTGRGISNELLNKIPLDLNNLHGQDLDNDSLPDNLEIALGTEVDSNDTDNDGFSDFKELQDHFSPYKKDAVLEYDSLLADSLAGFLLLQTEKNGQIWYVSPSTKKRVYIDDKHNVLNLIKKQCLGISEANYQKLFQNP